MFECKDLKNSALVISFIPFKNFAVALMVLVHGSFGMSDCGTCGIIFHSP